MTTQILAAVLAAPLLLPSGHPPPDPCALVTAADIAGALGSRPSAGKPHGPRRDEDTGAQSWSCDYTAGEAYLSIGFAELPTAAAAAAALRATAKLAADDEDGIRLSPQPGLGDGALWGSSDEGGIWVVHKGRHLLNVTAAVAGESAGLRDRLRKLAVTALAKL